jgi:hypothetical protein
MAIGFIVVISSELDYSEIVAETLKHLDLCPPAKTKETD